MLLATECNVFSAEPPVAETRSSTTVNLPADSSMLIALMESELYPDVTGNGGEGNWKKSVRAVYEIRQADGQFQYRRISAYDAGFWAGCQFDGKIIRDVTVYRHQYGSTSTGLELKREDKGKWLGTVDSFQRSSVVGRHFKYEYEQVSKDRGLELLSKLVSGNTDLESEAKGIAIRNRASADILDNAKSPAAPVVRDGAKIDEDRAAFLAGKRVKIQEAKDEIAKKRIVNP
jgi:hypothetical protein